MSTSDVEKINHSDCLLCVLTCSCTFSRHYRRVETFVKEQSSLLGAAKGELPTVITPKQYASRFLSFLDGIFLLS